MDKALAFPLSIHTPQKLKTWQLFIVLTVINIVVLFILNKFVLTRDVYYSLLSSRMEISRIDDYFNFINKFKIWGYLFTPLLLWLKISVVALLIQLPLMVKFIEIPFKQIFRIVAWANVSMIILAIAQIIYLLNIPASQFSQNTLSFIPLSLMNLINNLHFTAAAKGFINSINVFELIWLSIIYKGLSNTGKLEKIDSAILASGVWIGIAIFNFALLTYLNKMG
jgi:hypothetical protein